MNDRKSETMDTSLGKIFLTCRRGYSHILKETPCQDSGKYYESSDKFRIIAVADGHGHILLINLKMKNCSTMLLK
jgi:hypothetical protein